ncbi:hypothetical protein [Nocardiopsis ganjiahuensis]|uniref:hypothetical protein n=1 Tax=Nocardiopsis ganjiahuensis TaxID=239984 RepID=UPI00034C4240|nr:hypothetical protein [Nocardiopsis ganjiahuensis]
METTALVDAWRRLLINPDATWVLFEHGTCVVLTSPGEDLRAQALDLLREYGPILPGSPAGDFDVIHPDSAEGWVVTGHHADILTYVPPEAVTEESDLAIGLHGRDRRHRDAADPRIVHVEDGRTALSDGTGGTPP